MKQEISLDDVVLFLAVADHGGLSGAARQTGKSVPTLGRRMTALEGAMGTRLFIRGAKGYALTSEGVALRDQAKDLNSLATRLGAIRAQAQRPRVRITAGVWTSAFLVRHLARFWTDDMDWVPEFLPSGAVLDIARREADIGIRNRRPAQSWLAGQSTARIEYAPFARSAGATGWVTLPEDAGPLPSQVWLRQHHGNDILTTASDPRLALEIVSSGIGQMVLPCFVGEARGLVQTGAPIPALAHDEWLVSHHEARHDPPIRAALSGIAAVLTDRRLRG